MNLTAGMLLAVYTHAQMFQQLIRVTGSCMHTQYPSISTKPFASSMPGRESENSVRSSLAIPDSPPGGKENTRRKGERRKEA